MTTTTVINAQSIGTGSNVGVPVHASKLTCEALTTAYVINAQLTNGAARYSRSNEVRIWYASSPYNMTASQAADRCKQSARYLKIFGREDPSSITVQDTEVEVLSGQFLYIWLEVANQPAAQTISVIVTQLP